MKFNTKKGGPTAGSERKSMKMEADELMEKIKGCVKEALEEQKAEGEGGDEGDPAVDAQVLARYEAKKTKNFAEADRIRDELKAQGVEVTDVPGGAVWKRV